MGLFISRPLFANKQFHSTPRFGFDSIMEVLLRILHRVARRTDIRAWGHAVLPRRTWRGWRIVCGAFSRRRKTRIWDCGMVVSRWAEGLLHTSPIGHWWLPANCHETRICWTWRFWICHFSFMFSLVFMWRVHFIETDSRSGMKIAWFGRLTYFSIFKTNIQDKMIVQYSTASKLNFGFPIFLLNFIWMYVSFENSFLPIKSWKRCHMYLCRKSLIKRLAGFTISPFQIRPSSNLRSSYIW